MASGKQPFGFSTPKKMTTPHLCHRTLFSSTFVVLTLFFFFFFFFSDLAEGQALFTFGDSFVDNGNNNYLVDSNAKGNFPPYGVDFPAGPTGRITNGRNPSDVLAQHFGIPYLPPAFLNPIAKGKFILHGVNYASAGAGILDTTFEASHIIPLSKQVTNFVNKTVPELQSTLNQTSGVELSSFLSDAIFMSVIGGNDYNYQCFQSDSQPCDLAEFTTILIGNYSLQLQRLYRAGARKFVLYNAQPSGCNPTSRLSNNGSCVQLYNEACILFNDNLNASLRGFEEAMPGSKFVYVNSYNIISQVIAEPSSFGIQNIKEACCVVLGSDSMACEEYGGTCSDRSVYLYYDRVHPTEKVYNYLSTRAYLSDLCSEMHPINVKQLANIRSSSGLDEKSMAYKPSWAKTAYSYQRQVQ